MAKKFVRKHVLKYLKEPITLNRLFFYEALYLVCINNRIFLYCMSNGNIFNEGFITHADD